METVEGENEGSKVNSLQQGLKEDDGGLDEGDDSKDEMVKSGRI